MATCKECEHSGPPRNPDWADLGRPLSKQGQYYDEVYKTIIETPIKKKENKMKIFKFSVRRYVMGCTWYVTAKIAILLHPLVCQVWALVPIWSDADKASKVSMQVGPWAATILSIGIIVAAIYAFNKATAWLFGEKK